MKNTNGKPKISIIVPVYNAEQYLRDCLDSIVCQSFKDFELIIFDDGSTDESGTIINEYEKKYTFVKAFHQNNQGLFKTRENALRVASGEFIGWVDADDFIDSRMYEKLYQEIIDKNSELAICNYSFYPRSIKTKSKWFKEYCGVVNADFVERNSQPWNKLVKKELLDRLNVGCLFAKCHDEIYIRVLMEAKNPVTINEELYYYRMAGGMSSSYKNIGHYKKFVCASKQLKSITDQLHLSDYWNNYFENRITYYYLMTMIVCANANNKKEYLSIKKELYERGNFKKNEHYWFVLKNNFGFIKSFFIGTIIPRYYLLSRLLCKIAFKND